jgi:hypothetical protein
MARIAIAPILLIPGLTGLAVSNAQGQTLRTLSGSDQLMVSTTICSTEVPAPTGLPPATSGPVLYLLSLCPERGFRITPSSYLGDIHLRVSQPSQGVWVPYDADAERLILEDFQRLRDRGVGNVSVEIRDYRFPNGVIGKLVTYNLTERN